MRLRVYLTCVADNPFSGKIRFKKHNCIYRWSKAILHAICRMMAGGYVTLKEVAARAGVHLSTAARAMKNDPRLLPKTIEQVKEIARELGYTADPMLNALNAYRRSRQPARPHGTVAWVTNHPTREGWAITCYQLYRDGAAEQLAEHGYRLEDFWLNEPGLTAKRASQILFNRGIRGLLICPLPSAGGHLSLDWERFSAIAFGYSMVRPKLHLFTAAHYRSMITCMRKLRSLGYRRIGLVIPWTTSKRMDHIWTAAYELALITFPSIQRMETCFCSATFPGGTPSEAIRKTIQKSRSQFLRWYRENRPEAIVAADSDIFGWLEQEGHSAPEEVGLVCLNVQEPEERRAGIKEPSREIGRAAGATLVGMLQRGEYGPPRAPIQTLIEGSWFSGKTLRKQLATSKVMMRPSADLSS